MAEGESQCQFPKSLSRSLLKNNRVNVLECRVCEDVYTFHGDKVPRLLLCGHTLCHNCLLRLPVHEDKLLCPFDRQPTPLGDSGVWGLKKNFALLELLERLQCSTDREPFFTAEFLDKEKKLEISCDENEDHIAVVYCMVCSTNLCFECSERTHSMRTLAKHKRVPLSEKPKEKPKCVTHPSHTVEFICLEEECQRSPLMCFICKDYGRHVNHRHALLETEAERTRTQVLSALQHINKFIDEVNETTRKLEYAVQQIEGYMQMASDGQGGMLPQQLPGTAEDARIRIHAYFYELRENINRQEVAALTVVDAYVRERLCCLKQQQEDLIALLSQVAIMCETCRKIVQQDDARVILASHEIKAMLETIENQQQQFSELPEQLQLDPSIPLTFTKDNRVHIGPKIEMRIVTLGLDDAGKSSILFKLKQNEFVQTIPTIGFNVETVEYKNLKFTIWDVGGQPKLRPLWKHYYLNTQAIIFVVDSSNSDRLPEAHAELTKLVLEKELKEAALLIFANKQDLTNCLCIEEIAEKMALHKLCCSRSWHIQACDALSGIGLHDGLDWLARQLVAAGVTDVV